MALIKCPECGKGILNRTNIIANKTLILICLAITLLVCGCSKKSEYYIEKPKDNKFNKESVNELPDSDVELIQEFIPEVIEWYNSVDISKEQSIDFVTDEVDALGRELYESEIWTSYLDKFVSGDATEADKEKFEQVQKANAIYGKIAEIMMTTEMGFSLSEESEVTMTIGEEAWIELGEKIREAIDYYYQ